MERIVNKQKVAKLIDKLVLAHECFFSAAGLQRRAYWAEEITKIRAKLRKKGIPVDA